MAMIKNVVLVGGGAAGAYFLFRWLSGEGSGFGLGFGRGHPGGTKLIGGAESGPLEDHRGDGGSGEKPADGDESGEGDGSKTGGGSSGGEKNNSKKDAKDGENAGGDGKKSGTGGDKQSGKGDGSGGSGGGTGGGIGDYVGKGEGDILAQWDQLSDGSVEEGGGESENDDPNAGWGGVMIETDLPAPQLDDAKEDAILDQIHTLVWDTILHTNLAAPLDHYDSTKGSPRKWWADVVLHTHFDVPFGRLDPDNKTHVPWIGLWLDIHYVVNLAESALEAYSYS